MTPVADEELWLQVFEAAADDIEATPTRGEEGLLFGESVLAAGYEALEGREDAVDELLAEWPPSSEHTSFELDELLWCYKEPRGGMFTYNYTLGRVLLPSGRGLFLDWGDYVGLRGVGVAPRDASPNAHLRFLQLFDGAAVDVPFRTAGGLLFEIDIMWTKASTTDYILSALVDPEAVWMSDDLIEEGEERRGRLLDALDTELERGSLSENDYDSQTSFGVAPAWFMTLDEPQLESIAELPVHSSDDDPPLVHSFAEWKRPTPSMFEAPNDPLNLQHIAAAWVIGSFA